MKVDLTYYRRIFKELDTEALAPVYLFRGPERFIMEEMAGRIIEAAVPAELRSFNLTVSYGTEIDIESFISTAASYPFLADRRVLLLKELERFRGRWASLVDYCNNPAGSSIVVFFFVTNDEMGRRIKPPREFKKLESAIETAGSVIQFEQLHEKGIQRWASAKAKRMGITLDGDTTAALIRSVGENLFDLQNELQKLSLLHEGARITIDDLSRALGSYRMHAVYDLIERIGTGRDIDVLAILSRILETGAEKPSTIVYHLIRHFLTLFKIKLGLGGGGYRQEHLKRRADGYSIGEIVLWLENLRITELVLKSTSFPAETLIFGAILHSMNGKPLEDRYRMLGAA
ncbi:MAG TPA: DNA polymerase III subunit delta [Patescibacteria group bacterium]|nr:DNA polymerase III subunit delta [Patescibacteria group bacterium]